MRSSLQIDESEAVAGGADGREKGLGVFEGRGIHVSCAEMEVAEGLVEWTQALSDWMVQEILFEIVTSALRVLGKLSVAIT